MKKIVLLLFVLTMLSCSSKKTTAGAKTLYEILTTQADGGANIRFNEILTEEREIKMLQNDENLRKKIKPEDINSSNFVILNMGETTSTGTTIKIKSVEETADKIIIKVEALPAPKENTADADYYYPYTIIKINSKKPIVIE